MDKIKLGISVDDTETKKLEVLLNKLAELDKTLMNISGKTLNIGSSAGIEQLLKNITVGNAIGGDFGGAATALAGPKGLIIAAAGKILSGIAGAISTVSSTVLSSLSFTVNKSIEFAKQVIDAAGYRQNNIMTMTTLLGGDKVAGRNEFEQATRIADSTMFGTRDIVDTTTKLMISGFKGGIMENLRGRALDIATLFGDKNVLSEYTAAINKIQGKGKFTGEVESLDLLEKRLGIKNVRLGIASELGLKGNETSLLKQVQTLISKGKVDEITAINAINRVIGEKTGGGLAGSYSQAKAGDSIMGAVSNVEDAFSNALLRINWENSPGLKSFRTFLMNISNAIGSDGFKSVISDLAESIFGGFEKIKKSDIITWFQRIGEGIRTVFIPAIQGIWDFVGKLVKISSAGDFFSVIMSTIIKIATVVAEFMAAGIKTALPGVLGGDKNAIINLTNKYRQENPITMREEKLKAEQDAKTFAEARRSLNNNYNNHFSINIDAKNKDGHQIGQEIHNYLRTHQLQAGY